MKTFQQFLAEAEARNVRVPLDPYMTVPSGRKLKLIKKDIPPLFDDPLAKKQTPKVKVTA